MAGTLTFKIDDTFKRIVEHTLNAKEWTAAYGIGKPPEKPSLYLVKDRGAYLMPATKDKLKADTGTGCLVAYAKECPPDDWDAGQRICGGSDFAENVDCAVFARAIADGKKVVKIKLTEKTMEILA